MLLKTFLTISFSLVAAFGFSALFPTSTLRSPQAKHIPAVLKPSSVEIRTTNTIHLNDELSPASDRIWDNQLDKTVDADQRSAAQLSFQDDLELENDQLVHLALRSGRISEEQIPDFLTDTESLREARRLEEKFQNEQVLE